jgi:hypothetical protein
MMSRVTIGAITVLWSVIAAQPVRAQPPGYDIESLCGEVARYGGGMPSLAMLRGCYAQERASRDQLAQIWDQIPAAVRTRCAEVARLVGTGSYVMLNACVMAQYDAKSQAKH